jgi:hypothetical protein
VESAACLEPSAPLRVVLYAEGAGEIAGAVSRRLAPCSPLSEDDLGPGHLLVRRTLVSMGAADVRFEAPLKVAGSGALRAASGSDLLKRTTLRRLLSWPTPQSQPDLAVVLVDADGTSDRRKLRQNLVDLRTARVAIGIAVTEFESWLLADQSTLNDVMQPQVAFSRLADPETLRPGESKRLLADFCGRGTTSSSPAELRRAVASHCDLGVLASRSRSFADFRTELRHALA